VSETPSTAIEARLRETVGGRAPSFIELEAAAEIASLRAQLDEVRTLWRVIASVYDDKPDDYVVSVGHCLNQSLHHTQSKEG